MCAQRGRFNVKLSCVYDRLSSCLGAVRIPMVHRRVARELQCGVQGRCGRWACTRRGG